MNATKLMPQSESVTTLSPVTNRRQAGDCHLSPPPLKGGDSDKFTRPGDYLLRLRASPGNWLAPVERRLARLLKAMLRGYGFRCIDCRPTHSQEPANERAKPNRDDAC